MLVSAIVATLEWDTLTLSPPDSIVLGVLPISHAEIVHAKVSSLLVFAASFIIALNALPTVLHPIVMVANLSLNPFMIAPLILGRALSTMAAGAFGFACVLAIREGLYLLGGPRRFGYVSDAVRSALLFALLLLLFLVPSRLSNGNGWVFEGDGGPLLQRPAAWFAAMDTTIAGRVLDDVERRDLSTWDAEQDDRLVTQYRNGVPHMRARAARGIGVLLALMIVSWTMYLWNARSMAALREERGGAATIPVSVLADALAKFVAGRPASRAGLLFLGQTVAGSPLHRIYLIVSIAIGSALLIGMAPAGTVDSGLPVRTSQLAAQTLMLTAMAAGFRAAMRTSADPDATWLFGIADTGTIGAFRAGVRVGVLAAVIATVLILVPLHAAAWGIRIASMHAVNGAALGCLLVEIACGNVELPLVRTIPPNDAVNTLGAVFLGALVIGVSVLARIEQAALSSAPATAAFAVVMLSSAIWVRHVHERDHRAAAALPGASLSV